MQLSELWRDPRLRTLLVVNLAGIMERADEALLPSVYREIGKELDVSPTGLGTLTLIRSITQSLCYPLAAFLAMRHDRASVIALGAFLWAVSTFAVAISSSYVEVALSRGFNGVGLAIVLPAIQSMVADSSVEESRGQAFGWLNFTSTFGSILGGFLAIMLASTSFLGIAGWRLSFIVVALASVVVGVLVYTLAEDTRVMVLKTGMLSSLKADFNDLVVQSKKIVKLPTFRVLIAQGIVGTFPWAALAFAAMWLELTGFTNTQTALLLGGFSVACGIGSVFGGYLGDAAATRFPDAGRIFLSQFSTTSGIPLTALLVLVLPTEPNRFFLHAALFFAVGFFTSWNASATNNPIFAEIVDEEARTSIYALDRTLETFLASFAPPVVGLLAEKMFGFVQVPSSINRTANARADVKNAKSLGKALYTVYAVPFTVCVALYSLLYWTYPLDRRRQQMQAIEIQLEEATALPPIEEEDVEEDPLL